MIARGVHRRLATPKGPFGIREVIAKRYGKPWRGRGGVGGPAGMQFQAAFNWSDVQRIRDKFSVRLILKGIGTGEDATLACEEGVECVYRTRWGSMRSIRKAERWSYGTGRSSEQTRIG